MYLVNKPLVSGRLVIWFLLFIEYDFKIIYKRGRSHPMVDALSKLPNDGVPDQTCDAHLFTL